MNHETTSKARGASRTAPPLGRIAICLEIKQNFVAVTGTDTAPDRQIDGVQDETNRTVAEKQVHAAGVSTARRHGGPSRHKETTRPRVGRRNMLITMLSVDPGGPHKH